MVKRHNRIANRSADEHRNLAGLDWGTIERFQKRHPKGADHHQGHPDRRGCEALPR